MSFLPHQPQGLNLTEGGHEALQQTMDYYLEFMLKLLDCTASQGQGRRELSSVCIVH